MNYLCKSMEKSIITSKEFMTITSHEELVTSMEKHNVNVSKFKKNYSYEEELKKLQEELISLQHWIKEKKERVAIIFEGRDAAGKGGSIKRFKEHLNPRSMRVVALNKPTEVEQGQWYFRRYIKELPNPGELVFFDRSWYNRAVVEPVMGFCSDEQYKQYMVQVPEFEHMLYEDNVKIIKFWFDITKEEQIKRFDGRMDNPLKQWKFSPVDKKGQMLWNEYTNYKDQMFSLTHTTFSPWIIVETNDKKRARLESMRYVLSQFEYDGKGESGAQLFPDPNVVKRYFRKRAE